MWSKTSWSSPPLLVTSALLLSLLGNTAPSLGKDLTPAPQREFRAAWIATVANIDWPSKPGLSTAQQKQELVAMLDRASQLNLNAVVFQVRPHCDALYDSQFEPWSEYLTGVMGQAPAPYYDPLKFAIEQCHQRGLELHAWFNPYRASHPSAKSKLSAKHISKTTPAAVREYGKYLWLDPGASSAVEHSLAVILDVVQRYDIDGVHFDDYFYPYPINDENDQRLDFPDQPSWQAAQAKGNKLERNAWRRQNVDQFVSRVAQEVKRAKPWVKFGISPFGIWRPGHPKSVTGFDAYENLYADSLKWFREGHVDYLTPQLYWRGNSTGQSYAHLLKWWHEQNEQGRHLWPGNYTSKLFADGDQRWPSDEIVAQVWATRAQEGANGNVHFSMKALTHNSSGIADKLAAGAYAKPALVPASPWMHSTDSKPQTPRFALKQAGDEVVVQLTQAKADPESTDSVWQWAISAKYGAHWKTTIVPTQAKPPQLPVNLTVDGKRHELQSVAISAVDRYGQQSEYATITYP